MLHGSHGQATARPEQIEVSSTHHGQLRTRSCPRLDATQLQETARSFGYTATGQGEGGRSALRGRNHPPAQTPRSGAAARSACPRCSTAGRYTSSRAILTGASCSKMHQATTPTPRTASAVFFGSNQLQLLPAASLRKAARIWAKQSTPCSISTPFLTN